MLIKISAYFSSFLAVILLIFTYSVLGIPLKAGGKSTNLPLSGNTFYKKTNPTPATPPLSSNNSLMYENTAQSDMSSQEFEPKIFILSENIPYKYAYENEIKDGKFLLGEVFEVFGQSKDWMILVNFHGSTPLNTKSTFVPGTRTLSWASPFEYARYLFSNLSDAHNYSALLLDWQIRPQSEGQAANRHVYGDHITFLFIPPKTNMTFLIGFASAQDARDQRAGGGIQMRLKFLPQGTITVQTRLKFIKNSSLDSSKEYKNYDFERTYEDVVYAL